MSMLTTTETHGHFCFVAFFEELAQVSQLDVVVTNVSTRREFNFLNLDLLMFFAGFLFLLLSFKNKLAVIHYSTYRRFSVWHDLYEIHFRVICRGLCLFN